jgi:TDG/mug DNA glycosylase family protein
MDRRTVRIYERDAAGWVARRRPRAIAEGRLDAFASLLSPGDRVLDLGCGPAWYAQALHERGLHAIGLDVTRAMLGEARARAPEIALLRADLAAIPLRRGCVDAAWASACYMHLPRAQLAPALAHLHGVLRPGAPLWLTLPELDAFAASPAEQRRGEAERRDDREPFAGRLFSAFAPERARDLIVGAGFEPVALERAAGVWIWLRGRRARTLPDWVRPRLRLLVCGLNPSLYSADHGVPFARPGNRFWPAARAARIVAKDRDPWHALDSGVGFCDCVKRATARSSELARDEYASGLERVERLVRLHRPAVTCFVGLEGWRRASDPKARPGWIEAGFGGRPAYLMPSTSGLNAHETLDSLTRHLRRAARGPTRAPSRT